MAFGQSSYAQEFGPPYAGQMDEGNPKRITSILNKTGGSIRAGLAVKLGAVAGEAAALAVTGDNIQGVVALEMNTDPDQLAGTANYAEGVEMVLLEQGPVWVPVDFAVAIGDPVYVRFQAGAGTVNLPGAFGNQADAASCRLVAGAKWLSAQATAGGTAKLLINALTDAATR